MKISELLEKQKSLLSFEVFPPKTDSAYSSVETAVEEIATLKPDFMSVTYGAGGGTSDFTISIASDIQQHHAVPALAHLTCVSSTKAAIRNHIQKLQEAGIENILALRGDLPQDFDNSKADFHYADQLVTEIKKLGDCCIGGAC